MMSESVCQPRSSRGKHRTGLGAQPASAGIHRDMNPREDTRLWQDRKRQEGTAGERTRWREVRIPSTALQGGSWSYTEMISRPCVDCGHVTSKFCDHCRAQDRIPDEDRAAGQLTPLCSQCRQEAAECHFCRGQSWVQPPAWSVIYREPTEESEDESGCEPASLWQL